jgi:hypothetical protein
MTQTGTTRNENAARLPQHARTQVMGNRMKV